MMEINSMADEAPAEAPVEAPQAETALGGAVAPAEVVEKPADVPAEEAAAEEPAADEPFVAPVPDGMEEYGSQFEGYSKAVNDYLKENQEATAKDALAWAAQYQAEQV
ncbi:MAG: hypothetical protein ACRC0L_02140, partial [Angustibacter sp.]